MSEIKARQLDNAMVALNTIREDNVLRRGNKI